MIKLNMKTVMFAMTAALFLSGCTKSNIVKPEEGEAPDFNMYNDVELDIPQLHDDVEDICLDEQDYPMGSAIDFEVNLDEANVSITVVVKDSTDPEEISRYADEVIKCLNDQVAVQDFTYGESDDDTFGGLYQDNSISLKVYYESDYQNAGEPLYETEVPPDTYMTFDIE